VGRAQKARPRERGPPRRRTGRADPRHPAAGRGHHLQSYAKIKKFSILPANFTVDNGMLTPTLKVKRKVITEQYKNLPDSLYG
jgi:long-subunit acyl-CoA synthetase (AMP-forming)